VQLYIRYNMITIIVEHFLNAEGQKYFPNWIKHVNDLLEKNESFISIFQVDVIAESDKKTIETNRCILELKFSDLEALRIWVDTEEHKSIIKLLDEYKFKLRKTIIYGNNKRRIIKV